MKKKIIKKCDRCNDYGLRWDYMTSIPTEDKFCDCDFGKLRAEEYENKPVKKESTYQRYKRENYQLKQLIDRDVQMFCLSQKDFTDRLKFLKKMTALYQYEQMEKLKNEK